MLSELVDAAVGSCHEDLQDRGVRLHVSLPHERVELMADRARLIQVLCNLISNSAKYTPRNGRIDVAALTDGTVLRMSVKDDGIGIPRERLADIFELFAQVDRSSDRTGGLGIGLTLVRQIVTLHGGSIEAHSEGADRGSEFVFMLPVVAVQAAVHPPVGDGAATSDVTPRRILVVDDNRDAAESLSTLLQLAGHDVRFALDGESAIALARQDRPEVVLLDLGMPKVSGYEVAERIRRQPFGQRVYLVAISGWGQAEERRRTQAAGFDAHLIKPVAPEVLSRLLETMSGRNVEPESLGA